MKAGQKLVHNGHEVCLFPMETMNITQWSSPTADSHCCGHPLITQLMDRSVYPYTHHLVAI